MSTLLMATRRDATNPAGEAEPVIVVNDPRGLRFVLDDGLELVFDAIELRAAMQPAKVAA